MDSASASELNDDDRKAIYDEAVALREQIYGLRGRIVSAVSALEGWVDTVLCGYFGQKGAMNWRFRTWVLAAMTFDSKLKVLGEVMTSVGVKPQVTNTLLRLSQANVLRNDVAHSHVSPNMAVPQDSTAWWQDFWKWHSSRTTRRGLQFSPIDVAELTTAAEFTEALEGEVLRLFIAALVPEGQEASTHLEEFDSKNPDIARAARRRGTRSPPAIRT